MSKKVTTEQFIERANIVHNFKYNYSKAEYLNNKTKINIICPDHGDFFQASDPHLKGSGCPKCVGLYKYTTIEFIDKANLIHNNKYNYSLVEYKNASNKVTIICPIHNIAFNQLPSTHLQGVGCPNCGHDSKGKILSLTVERFVQKANIIHNFNYDYSLINYIDINTKVNIICKNCNNNFYQKPKVHLLGSGCLVCNTKGWTKTQWINYCDSKKYSPLVYIIRCYNKTENFIKIGITAKSIKERFHNKKYFPYSYEIIKIIQGSPDFIWDKEQELHKLYKDYTYTPVINFGGYTECFNISILNFILH